MLLDDLIGNKFNDDFVKYDLDNFYKYCPNNSYIPTVLPAKKRIIVIGDLHADLDLTLRCLRLAKVIDKNGEWIGGKTVVVQTGDKVDGCRPIPNIYNCIKNHVDTESSEYSKYNADEDIKILELFYNLHKKAESHGGAVYSLLGNHELMNVEGNLKYVSKKSLEEFADYKDGKINFKEKFSHLSTVDRGIVARKYAFSPGNKWSTFLACTNIGCIIIGSFLFVHGGIVPEFIKELGIKSNADLVKVNHLVRLWLLGLIEKEKIHKIISGEKHSLFWDRMLASIPSNVDANDDKCKTYLDPVLKLLNVGNMVIGHTPQVVNGINSSCSGKLWKIDIGASKAFASYDVLGGIQLNKKNMSKDELRKAQVLEILDDKVINILK